MLHLIKKNKKKDFNAKNRLKFLKGKLQQIKTYFYKN